MIWSWKGSLIKSVLSPVILTNAIHVAGSSYKDLSPFLESCFVRKLRKRPRAPNTNAFYSNLIRIGERELTVDGTRGESVPRRYLCKRRSRFTEKRARTPPGLSMQIYGSRAPLLSRNPSARRDSRKHLEARRGVQLTPPRRRVSSSWGEGHIRGRNPQRTRTRAAGESTSKDRTMSFSLSRANRAATHLEWSHDWSAVFGALFACVCSIYKTLTGKRGWRADLGVLPACPRTQRLFLRARTMLRSSMNLNVMPLGFGQQIRFLVIKSIVLIKSLFGQRLYSWFK